MVTSDKSQQSGGKRGKIITLCDVNIHEAALFLG